MVQISDSGQTPKKVFFNCSTREHSNLLKLLLLGFGGCVFVCLFVLLCLSFLSLLTGNIMVLWSTCRTSVLKSVTNRFIKNLACSGICASLVCVPFDIALSASPHCCWWIYTMLFCRIAKFLHKVFCSVTILSFPAIALDR